MKNIISMFIMCLVVICGACSNEDDYNNSSSSQFARHGHNLMGESPERAPIAGSA